MCRLGLVLDFSLFPQPWGFIFFLCLFYLWKGFSCSWQSGTGSDCSSKGGCILVTAQPCPSLLPAHATVFTVSAAVAEAANRESLVPEAGELLLCAASQPRL